MNAIRDIILGIGGTILILLTLSLFVVGFAEHNSGYSIGGAILAGCELLALAIASHRGT